MPDPVAWTVMERGWKVLGADGAEVGRVDEITGDENADIFDGLTVSKGVLSKPKYVPSEHVAQIFEGEVHLSLSQAQIEALEGYTEPVEEQIVPERSTWYQRFAWRWLAGRKR
jgi:hypothetical protein